MFKHSRPFQQCKLYTEFLNDKGSSMFDSGDHDDALCATFAHLLFIQLCVLFFYYAFLLDNLTFRQKVKAINHEHTPFDEKVGYKLSDCFFCQIYQTERRSFN